MQSAHKSVFAVAIALVRPGDYLFFKVANEPSFRGIAVVSMPAASCKENVMRFFLRFLSLISLVIAVIAATIDSIQSVSASRLVLTSFGDAWLDASPTTLIHAEALIEQHVHPLAWERGLGWLLAQPAFAVFLVLSLLLWMLAYRRPSVVGRFAA